MRNIIAVIVLSCLFLYIYHLQCEVEEAWDTANYEARIYGALYHGLTKEISQLRMMLEDVEDRHSTSSR